MQIKSVIWVFVVSFIVSVLLLNQQIQNVQALQFATYSTVGNPLAVIYMNLGGNNDFVTLSSLTQVRVQNADTNGVIRSFNMTNALQSGTAYQFLNMACNSALDVCVAGYTCGCTTAGARERIVLIDPLNGAWSSLARGANYTSSSVALENIALSFGQTQFNVFATYADQAGIAHTKIDTWVYNSTDGVNAHPLVFGNTFDTGTVTLFDAQTGLGTFTVNGVLSNMEAETTGFPIFDEFNRGTNVLTCGVNPNGGANTNQDIKFVSDNTGQYWLVTDGHIINKITSACVISATIDASLTAGCTTNIGSISVDNSRHEIYTTCNGKVLVYNETSFSATILTSFVIPASPALNYGEIANVANGNNGEMGIGVALSEVYLIYWNTINGSGNSSAGQLCVNTVTTGTALVCFKVCDASGIPNTSCPSAGCPNGQTTCPYVTTNSFSTFQVGQNVTTSTNQLGCSVGLINCQNTNIQTNGTGYILLLLLILYSIALLFWIAWQFEHSVGEIPPYVWFAVLFVDLGIGFFLGWTNGLPFYGTLIGAIGLGALGIGSYIVGRVR